MHDVTTPSAIYIKPSTGDRLCAECRRAYKQASSQRYRDRRKKAQLMARFAA